MDRLLLAHEWALERSGLLDLRLGLDARRGPRAARSCSCGKAVADFAQNNNFSLNANSSLAIIKWSPAAPGSAGKGDVIVWSGANGVFAGLDVSGADIHADTGYDKAYL